MGDFDNTAAGGATMNPWLAGAGMVADLAGGLAGGEQPQDYGNLHLVNAGQQSMWNQMAGGLMNGQGDFGFGSNYKQGKSQVQDFMASRGVKMDPSSGAYAGAMGNMTGQAMGMDSQARNNYAMQLLGTPMQVAQGNGANFLTNSTSRGANFDAQQGNYWNRDRSAEWPNLSKSDLDRGITPEVQAEWDSFQNGLPSWGG